MLFNIFSRYYRRIADVITFPFDDFLQLLSRRLPLHAAEVFAIAMLFFIVWIAIISV